MGNAPQSRPRALIALRMLPWLVVLAGPLIVWTIAHASRPVSMLTAGVALGVFFLALIARIVLAAAESRNRRLALLFLLVGIILWAAGSAVINVGSPPGVLAFPQPDEVLFLLSYLALAGWLALDASRRRAAAGLWMETAVICGGTACLAGSLLITQGARALDTGGLGVLLALLYPLLDLVLGLLVIGQATQGMRHERGRTAMLLIGLACFTVADSSFLLNVHDGTYQYAPASKILWGLGFVLLVEAATARRGRSVAQIGERRSSRAMSLLVVAAGLAAACVLAFEPSGRIREYLLVPALATLCAAGARLAIALRDAHRATEAVMLSRTDDLTGLPNRRQLLLSTERKLEGNEQFALMILDLDGFKDINDTLGHGAGDAVLFEIAARMRETLDASVVLARLGGDEFALLIPETDEIMLMETAGRVLEAIRTPLLVDGIGMTADASIGITVRNKDDSLSSELLRRADVAMYDAKHKRAGALIYNPDVDGFSRARLRLGDELRNAITDRQLTLWYQPQATASTGRVSSFEALVRWKHPKRGLLSPAEFLPVARRAGLMQALSEEIARIAIDDLLAWGTHEFRPRVALNCAPPELLSGVFVSRLMQMLAGTALSPAQLTVEVTEDSFLSEPERARRVIAEITDLGFDVSLDDYGTGFSSLSYLRDLPIRELKIDQSFVSTMRTDERSRMIVSSTLQMARALRLRTVAEGVEDAETSADLIALGVDMIQGWHLGRPMPADQVEGWLSQQRLVLD